MHFIRTWKTCRAAATNGFLLSSSFVLLHLITLSLACAGQNIGTQLSAGSAATSATQSPSHEITVAGSIQQAVSNSANSPAGIHLLVSGPQGPVDASLGSNLTPEVQQSLQAGEPVQLVGSTETINGKEYLLVRQLTIAGRQITVRNQHGFLVHTQPRSHTSVNPIQLNGGVR